MADTQSSESTEIESSIEVEAPDTNENQDTEVEESLQDQIDDETNENEVTGDQEVEGEQEEQTTESDEQEKDQKDSKSEARRYYQIRHAKKQQIQDSIAQNYRAQTAEEIVEETGVDEVRAEVEALKQQQAINDYRMHVTELNSNLESDSMSAMKDYPVFDPESDQYDQSFSEFVADRYMRYGNVQLDNNQEYIVSADIPLYDFFKDYAETYSNAAKKGSIQGQRNADKQLSRIAPPTSSAATSSDDFESLEARVANIKF